MLQGNSVLTLVTSQVSSLRSPGGCVRWKGRVLEVESAECDSGQHNSHYRLEHADLLPSDLVVVIALEFTISRARRVACLWLFSSVQAATTYAKGGGRLELGSYDEVGCHH